MRRESAEPVGGTELYRMQFSIRNVRASLIAYWLDPSHHAAPPEMQISRSVGSDAQLLQNIPRLPGNGNGPEGLKLPDGVNSLVVIDPQNSIFAVGSPKGLEALRTLLATVDVPLAQYEIEAQFLEIPRGTLSSMGLKFDKPVQESPYSFGSVTMAPANFQQIKAAELVKEGHVKILTAPRIVVIDGLMGQVQSTTSTPFVADAELAKQYPQTSTDAPAPTTGAKPQSPPSASVLGITPGVAYITSSIGFRATALQRKDDLVTLAVTPMLGTRSISVTTTVRDGESFAIQMSPPREANQVIVIITPRRVRRVGDN